jgi:hypothetical protein
LRSGIGRPQRSEDGRCLPLGLNGYVPFKQVADILGHARLETTAIYAKLDLETLAKLALPFPGGKR